MCDPQRSGIDDDPRKAYYSKVETWTSKYAAEIGMYGSYTHDFKPVNVVELLHWDSILLHSGVLGKLDGNLYKRWDEKDVLYCSKISECMNYTRWLQIKRVVKLCDNDAAPKRGKVDYNPAYKYDYGFMFL